LSEGVERDATDDFGKPGRFEMYVRKSCPEEFLNLMDVVVPWGELEALIEPFYPKAGNRHQPVGLSIMLHVYFLQLWIRFARARSLYKTKREGQNRAAA
jgi:hypothetical protein